jgi:hypothetical protein
MASSVNLHRDLLWRGTSFKTPNEQRLSDAATELIEGTVVHGVG